MKIRKFYVNIKFGFEDIELETDPRLNNIAAFVVSLPYLFK